MKARPKRKPSKAVPALEGLAERIVRRRKAAGLTQETFVEKADISVRSLQTLEAGTLNPSFLTLQKVAAALGVSVSRLLSGL